MTRERWGAEIIDGRTAAQVEERVSVGGNDATVGRDRKATMEKGLNDDGKIMEFVRHSGGTGQRRDRISRRQCSG